MKTRAVAKIKLIICGDDWKKIMYWMACVSNELNRERNIAIRRCVAYMQNNIDNKTVKKEDGRSLSYASYIDSFKTDPEFATKTLASHARIDAVNEFLKFKKDILKNMRSIPRMKDDSIPCRKQGRKIYKTDGRYFLEPSAMNKTKFEMIGINKDKSLSVILDGILSGAYDQHDSKLIKRKGFWYLYIVHSHEIITKSPNKNIVCGIDSNANSFNLLSLAIKDTPKRLFLGGMDDILKMTRKVSIQKKRSLQKNIKLTSSGHGRTKKLKALDRFENKEHEVRTNYNHLLSRETIKFCVANNVGMIRMEKLTGIHDDIQNKFLRRNWTYYQLQKMIEYKAKNQGIDIEYINPRYTSQTCSGCGHRAKENRVDQQHFVCQSCGLEINADYNAALNIASFDAQPFSRLEGEGNGLPLSHSPDTTPIDEKCKVSGSAGA